MIKKGAVVTTNNAIIPCFLFIDCLIVAGVVVLWYFLEFSDEFTVAKQGFYCNDKDLMKPYIKDDDLVLPKIMIYIMCFALPVVVILFGESSLSVYHLKSKTYEKQEKIVKTCNCCDLHPVFRRMIRFIGMCTFGGFATWVLTDVSKLLTGRLTPFFLTVCAPNMTHTDCVELNLVTDDSVCTGDADEIKLGRMSFPSLNAALSMHCAVFIALYVQSLLSISGSRLLGPLLSLGVVTLSYMCGLLDMQQYRHNSADVLLGFLIGAAVAAYLSIVVLNFFNPTPKDSVAELAKEGIGVVTLPRPKSKYSHANGNQTYIPHALDRSSSRRSEQIVISNPAYLEDGAGQLYRR
ncbi:phospholipid phosphatase-related protein type 1-like [Ptychodera flava]|uniref:phospholipid phosphatase-related protein type 1-like n=1 Tax=Ptychodera flava TaxID=63121 RepID=UPI00396A29C2